MSNPIVFIDSAVVADYSDSDGELHENAIHVIMTIPADRRDDVDRNDTARRELTGILEAAIEAMEA